MTVVLFVLLGLAAIVQIYHLVHRGKQTNGPARPTSVQLLIGFVTNFFDTLGIGNFAPTTAAYRWLRVVPDEAIPGTMNAGHTLPVLAMAFLFIGAIEVEPATLVGTIAAAMLGAWLGAGSVAKLPRHTIQVGMGIALLVAAALFVMGHFDAFPVGGLALGLSGLKLCAALLGTFVFGALMTIGVGFYAPCMILVALLGMNPKAAFPIMMGACAFLMPIASARFLRSPRTDLRAGLGLTLGGLPAVFLAALVVVELPLLAVRWLVIVVSIYSGIALLCAARTADSGQPSPTTH